MSLQLIPKAGMLLVKPIQHQPAKSESGLIQLADVYHEPETSGEVIALAERFVCEDCGAGRESDLNVGDVVVFTPSTGDELEWQGDRYLLIPEAAVLGVVVEV